MYSVQSIDCESAFMARKFVRLISNISEVKFESKTGKQEKIPGEKEKEL